MDEKKFISAGVYRSGFPLAILRREAYVPASLSLSLHQCARGRVFPCLFDIDVTAAFYKLRDSSAGMCIRCVLSSLAPSRPPSIHFLSSYCLRTTSPPPPYFLIQIAIAMRFNSRSTSRFLLRGVFCENPHTRFAPRRRM